MKYYLVALFDNNSHSNVETIQRHICKKYKLYKKLSTLHITLEVIDEPNLNELDTIISDIIKPYKRFKVELNDFLCLDNPNKSVNLKVENKGYIIRLSRNINEKLRMHGFKVRDNIDDLHIPLANANYTTKKLSGDQAQLIFQENDNASLVKMAKIDRIELWKTVNNKKTLTIKSYPLKEY